MNVRVQFFAQLRDLAGVHQLDVDLPERSTIARLLEAIYEQKPALRAHDKSILVGAGVEFVDRDYVVKGGDAISIMPPVQGG
jgi:molybdopterin converting factor small subunit